MKKNSVTTKSTFAKKLLSLSQRYHTWEVWSDFIVMFAIALSNGFDKSNYDEREAMYMKIINKYTEAERMVFPELVAEVAIALTEEPEQDFLGNVYMELELGNHWIGQFFTPYNVCELMAEISTGTVVEQIQRNGYVTLNDCACGAGATLIAGVHSIKHALERNNSPLCWQNHVLITAQDIDFTTGLMCYIQLSLLGCAGYVKIGNTITDPMCDGDDISKYWFTPMYFSDVWQQRRIIHRISSLMNAHVSSCNTSNTADNTRYLKAV